MSKLGVGMVHFYFLAFSFVFKKKIPKTCEKIENFQKFSCIFSNILVLVALFGPVCDSQSSL